jgi:hypothetical protein
MVSHPLSISIEKKLVLEAYDPILPTNSKV